MTAVRYRKASVSDVPSIVQIRGKGESGGATEERMMGYLSGEHHPQQALPNRIMFLATENESPVGYVAGHLTRRFACQGELQWIYVTPERRGSDIAGDLLRLLAKWFVEQAAVYVCVDVGNAQARRFYQRHGAIELNEHWLVWNDIGTVLK